MLFPIRDYNPTRRFSYLTILIIVLNVMVFAYQNFLAPQPAAYYVYSSSLIPWEITHWRSAVVPVVDETGTEVATFNRHISPPLSLISSLFMHGSLMHLIGNMLFLWIFGNNIEDRLGRLRFLLFYFAAGIGASLIHVLFNPGSLIPVIGASGAISGVMGAYLILYPQARIRTLVFLFIFVTFIDIPAAVFLIVWFLFQFLYVGGGAGIAWLAHVGGFLLGMALVMILGGPKKLLPEAATPAIGPDEGSGGNHV